jgi:hypothetical protein
VLLLVAALEVVGLVRDRLRPSIDPALDLILPFAVLSAFGAFVLGLILAQEGGLSTERLSLHRKLALGTLVLCCVQTGAWFHHRSEKNAGPRLGYRAALALTLGALTLASHQGGTLSRGDGYLAKYAPSFLTPLLGKTDGAKDSPQAQPVIEQVDEPDLYAHAVEPLLDKYCAECHGAEEVKGGLRLNSLAALQKGGESGPALTPFRSADSRMVKRLLLPEGDEDRMPPEDSPAPTNSEIEVIRF